MNNFFVLINLPNIIEYF